MLIYFINIPKVKSSFFYIIILFTLFFVCTDPLFALDQASSTSGRTLSPRQTQGPRLDSKYCLNLQKLASFEMNDGLDSESAPLIAQKSSNSCKGLSLPTVSPEELLSKMRKQPEFIGIGDKQHNAIKECLKNLDSTIESNDQNKNKNKNRDQQIKSDTANNMISKYYYYTGRFKAGLEELIPQGKLLEKVLPSLTGEKFRQDSKIHCELNYQFQDLRSKCDQSENCENSQEIGNEFIAGYWNAYQRLLFYQEKLSLRLQQMNETKSMRMEHNDPLTSWLKDQINKEYAEYPLLAGDTFKSQMKSGLTDKLKDFALGTNHKSNESKFKSAMIAQIKESHKKIRDKVRDILSSNSCITTQVRSCDEKEIFDSIKNLPTLNPKYVKGQGADVAKSMARQQCLYEQKVMKNEIRTLMGDLAKDAGLAFATMGIGSAFGAARVGLFLNAAADAAYSANSIKSAYDECSKKFNPAPNMELLECKKSSTFLKQLNEHSECTTSIAMAALNTMIPGAGLALGKVSKAMAYEASRMKKAEEVLGRGLTENEKLAIQKAHEVGAGQFGRNADRFKKADGTYDLLAMQKEGIVDQNGNILKNEFRAQVNNYTELQLREKAKILDVAGIGINERRILMKNKIVGSEFEDLLGRTTTRSVQKDIDEMSAFELVDEIKLQADKVNELKSNPNARPLDRYHANNKLLKANSRLEQRGVEEALAKGDDNSLFEQLIKKDVSGDQFSKYKTTIESAKKEKSQVEKTVSKMSEDSLADVRRLTPDQQAYFFSLKAEMESNPNMISFTSGQKKQIAEMEEMIKGSFIDSGSVVGLLDEFKKFPVKNMKVMQNSFEKSFISEVPEVTHWPSKMGDYSKISKALSRDNYEPIKSIDVKKIQEIISKSGDKKSISLHNPTSGELSLMKKFLNEANRANDPYVKIMKEKTQNYVDYWELHDKIVRGQ